MKTRKELEIELEKLNYRFISLSDIPTRRDITDEEQAELENIEIRIGDVKRVLNQKIEKSKIQFLHVGKTITLLAAVMFLLLTVYSVQSAYHFMSLNQSVDKQVIMGVTTVLTFLLTIGSSYAYSRQAKMQWK